MQSLAPQSFSALLCRVKKTSYGILSLFWGALCEIAKRLSWFIIQMAFSLGTGITQLNEFNGCVSDSMIVRSGNCYIVSGAKDDIDYEEKYMHMHKYENVRVE